MSRLTVMAGAKSGWLQSLLLSMIVGVGLVLPHSARAQSVYPARPISFIAPISGGTVLDILARLYADRIAKLLNGSIVVVNRPGAGGLIAAQAVATSPADGYTFLVANAGHYSLNLLHKSLPFDPVNDFVAVAMLGESPAVVVVPSSLGVKSLKEFVDLAKSKPGAINYVSLGNGSSTHIAGAYFEKQANIQMTHVPYKDMALSATDLAGNVVQVVFSPVTPHAGQIQSGTLRGLAVSAREPLRIPVAVPTAISQDVDYIYSTWYGLLALKSTPADVIDRVSRAVSEIGKDPDIVSRVEAQGIVATFLPAAEFQKYIAEEFKRLRPVLKEIEAMPSADR
jgi:tripartite-type tricarboxylate transporter receptor subunit TctC